MPAELDEQCGANTYGRVRYDVGTLYWMGCLYRCWSAAFGITSKRAYKTIQARELSLLHLPCHSLDPAQAIERICEARGIEPEQPKPSDDHIKEGVALLRRMHQRSSYEYFATRM